MLSRLHPQSDAKEIGEYCKSIGEYACLAMCYIYCSGMKYSDAMQYIKMVNRAIKTKILDKECTVLSASKFLNFVAGGEWSVTKKTIPRDIKSVREIKNATPVRYYAEGHGGHWVVVENGKIVFNSLESSYNVNYGKPIEARVIKELGVKG